MKPLWTSGIQGRVSSVPARRQTCDSEIMDGSHKGVTWWVSERHVFVTGGRRRGELCDLGKDTHSNPEGAAFHLH